MPTASKDVIVCNKNGLHARPAMQLLDLANRFKSDLKVLSFGDPPVEADAKSITQLLTLAAVPGTVLKIIADGEDAEAAVEELAKLIENKFGEEE